jgi:hypothetical protein
MKGLSSLWSRIRSDQWPLSDGITLEERFRCIGKSFCGLFAKPLDGCMDLEEQFFFFFKFLKKIIIIYV